MLTPIDIQNHSLKTAVRGYSKKETDDFLEEIIKSYEEIYRENRELKDKLSSLSDGIQYYKGMESTLQKALVLAEKTSSETQEAAKSKADALTSEAETKAEAMTSEAQTKAEALIQEAKARADAMKKEADAYAEVEKAKAKQELKETRNHVKKLVQSYENYRLQFKKLAESQIEMLDSEHFSIFAPELEEMMGEDAPDADQAMEAEETVPINVGISSKRVTGDTPRRTEDDAVQAREEKTATDTDKVDKDQDTLTPEDVLQLRDILPKESLEVLENASKRKSAEREIAAPAVEDLVKRESATALDDTVKRDSTQAVDDTGDRESTPTSAEADAGKNIPVTDHVPDKEQAKPKNEKDQKKPSVHTVGPNDYPPMINSVTSKPAEPAEEDIKSVEPQADADTSNEFINAFEFIETE